MALIGIDVGTTGSKCTIFDYDGNIKSFAYKEYDIINSAPGNFEINPDEVWSAVRYVIGEAARNCGCQEFKALCVSSFGESVVPIGKDGKVLCNSMLYTDARGVEQCGKIVDRLGLERIMKLTGVNAHPMYTINKVVWLKENKPEIYRNTWKFMLFEDYILYRLGKVAIIDYSLASRTMAFNITEKKWEETIFCASGIDSGLFSEAAPSGTTVGKIDPQVAEDLGISKDILLVTGGHDQVCAAVGGGILRPGIAIDGMGTVECITPAFGKPVLDEFMMNNNFACVPHAVNGMYVTYAFNFTGGSLLKWYRNNFAGRELLESENTGKSVYCILDEKASEKPTDLFVLPHFAGAGTPYMDTKAKGAILGLDFNVSQGQLYRAMLEGITYEMMYNAECLSGSGIVIDELRAVGGGAKSDLWLQIKADMMGKKVITLNVDEAGTLGTAILAGVAAGIYGSVEDAVNKLVRVKKEFYPDKTNHEIYKANYTKYKKLYESVKSVFN